MQTILITWYLRYNYTTGIFVMSFAFSVLTATPDYRLITLSQPSVNSRKIFVFMIEAFLPLRSDSRTPRVLAHEPQT